MLKKLNLDEISDLLSEGKCDEAKKTLENGNFKNLLHSEEKDDKKGIAKIVSTCLDCISRYDSDKDKVNDRKHYHFLAQLQKQDLLFHKLDFEGKNIIAHVVINYEKYAAKAVFSLMLKEKRQDEQQKNIKINEWMLFQDYMCALNPVLQPTDKASLAILSNIENLKNPHKSKKEVKTGLSTLFAFMKLMKFDEVPHDKVENTLFNGIKQKELLQKNHSLSQLFNAIQNIKTSMDIIKRYFDDDATSFFSKKYNFKTTFGIFFNNLSSNSTDKKLTVDQFALKLNDWLRVLIKCINVIPVDRLSEENINLIKQLLLLTQKEIVTAIQSDDHGNCGFKNKQREQAAIIFVEIVREIEKLNGNNITSLQFVAENFDKTIVRALLESLQVQDKKQVLEPLLFVAKKTEPAVLFELIQNLQNFRDTDLSLSHKQFIEQYSRQISSLMAIIKWWDKINVQPKNHPIVVEGIFAEPIKQMLNVYNSLYKLFDTKGKTFCDNPNEPLAFGEKFVKGTLASFSLFVQRARQWLLATLHTVSSIPEDVLSIFENQQKIYFLLKFIVADMRQQYLTERTSTSTIKVGIDLSNSSQKQQVLEKINELEQHLNDMAAKMIQQRILSKRQDLTNPIGDFKNKCITVRMEWFEKESNLIDFLISLGAISRSKQTSLKANENTTNAQSEIAFNHGTVGKIIFVGKENQFENLLKQLRVPYQIIPENKELPLDNKTFVTIVTMSQIVIQQSQKASQNPSSFHQSPDNRNHEKYEEETYGRNNNPWG